MTRLFFFFVRTDNLKSMNRHILDSHGKDWSDSLDARTWLALYPGIDIYITLGSWWQRLIQLRKLEEPVATPQPDTLSPRTDEKEALITKITQKLTSQKTSLEWGVISAIPISADGAVLVSWPRDSEIATVPQTPVRCGSSVQLPINRRYCLFPSHWIPLCQAGLTFDRSIRETFKTKMIPSGYIWMTRRPTFLSDLGRFSRNINSWVIFVISASFSSVWSDIRIRYGSERSPHASPSLPAKQITEKAHFWTYLDCNEVDNTIYKSKLFWSMTHKFLWRLYLHVLHSEKLARSWSATSKCVT
jgi:hypothetical protein